MGSVYRVWDRKLGKYWAMKELRCKNREQEMSLCEELHVLKNVEHSFFPRIVEVIYEQDRVCLLMDWLDGPTLEQIVRKEGPLPVKKAAEYMLQLCDAVEALHQMRPPVLFLDLKPSNILLAGDGVKLVDFGSALSGWTGRQAYAGTPGYASPEQMDAAHRQVDERSDIYSLGAVYLYLLTGKTINAKLGPEGCFGPQIPEPVRSVLRRAMQERREERFSSAEELKQALLRSEKQGFRHLAARLLSGMVTAGLLLFAAVQGAAILEGCYDFLYPGGNGVGRQIAADTGLRFCFGVLLPAALSCLWERRRQKNRRCIFRQSQSILRTEKRKGLWMGFTAGLAASMLAGVAREADRVSAQEPVQIDCAISVRDEDMRRLLIRTGAVYKASGPVFIEIPWELLREEENMKVEVLAGTCGQEKKYRLAFSCGGKKPDSP